MAAPRRPRCSLTAGSRAGHERPGLPPISARIPGPEHQFMINPYGWCSMKSRPAAWSRSTSSATSSATRRSRSIRRASRSSAPSARCTTTPVVCCTPTPAPALPGIARRRACCRSASSPRSFVRSSLAYRGCEDVALWEDEKPRPQADLGNRKYLVLRNHGLLTIGRTVADAFLAMYTF